VADEETHDGGCQCGAVRYRITGPLIRGHVCHCRMCQRATGGLFAALIGQTPDHFAWVRGEPAIFASSSIAERGFCRDCGTPLSFAYRGGETAYVTIGSLDAPEAASIHDQFGIESRLPFVTFCEEVPGQATGEHDPGFFAGMQNHQAPTGR
jgi:hypothetical protein